METGKWTTKWRRKSETRNWKLEGRVQNSETRNWRLEKNRP